MTGAPPAVVMDNGTGYTKLGFAGNTEPQFVVPTAIATRAPTATGRPSAADEMDFVIGDDAVGARAGSTRTVHYPVRHGQVENWDLMEQYWEHCFFRLLRCDPEAHAVLLTEPPLNAPENREAAAEAMFETFGVPALHIAVQAVLALAASWLDGGARAPGAAALTGTVVDAGDGVTHIIPVVEGYAVGSAVRHVPMAGRELTLFVQQMLRERPDVMRAIEGAGRAVDVMELAKRIKAEQCYVCDDPVREMLLYDAALASGGAGAKRGPAVVEYADAHTSARISVRLGAERFLAPEVFFNPDLLSGAGVATGAGSVGGGTQLAGGSASNSNAVLPLPVLLDAVVQACPIDARRGLYGNVVLSGGSTLFPGLAERLQRDTAAIVGARLGDGAPAVRVLAHRHQRHAVWTGGALLASMDAFPAYCVTKAQYDEHGPSICRQSRVLSL